MFDLLAGLLHSLGASLPLDSYTIIPSLVHEVVSLVLCTTCSSQDDAGLHRTNLALCHRFL